MFDFFKKKDRAKELQEEIERELEEERKAKEALETEKDAARLATYQASKQETAVEETTEVEEAPVVGETVAEEVSVEETVVEKTPVVEETTVVETPVVEEVSVVEVPTVEETVVEETSVVETPVVETPVVEEVPVVEVPTVEETTVVETLAVGEAPIEETPIEETPVEEVRAEEPVTKMGLFSRLKAGLAKTRNNIVASMDSIFSNDEKIDDDFYEELEEILILGDIGVHTTENILEKLKTQVKSEHIRKRSECREFLINSIKEEMAIGETAYEFERTKSVVFVIGVNGVGKTTSIGKMASHLKSSGKKVMLAACDTFRAAAGSQLEEWSHRAGVDMIGGVEGQDPSSVLFDAVTSAKARGIDVLLVDTAGRLHNKKNLMEELKKMNRIIDKVYPEVHRENMIVLDASTGQNALNQAKEFGEVADLTGIILTKMDGTAKGGIAIAIQSELGVPVKYIGVGEKIVDLQKFDADSFVDALFDVKLEEDN